MNEWLQEIRYSVRTMVKAPVFAIVAVLSLALGIGVNTAVFAVARAVLLTPLPVPDPGRLVIAQWWRGDEVKGSMSINSGSAQDEATGRALRTNYDYTTYTALRDAVREEAGLFAFTFVREANLSFEGQPVVGGGMLVSGNYFQQLGVPVHVGRPLDERDDRPDAEPAAVLGFGLWQRAFGGDPAIVGKTVRVNGRAFSVVGVTARGYFGVSNGGFFPPADITMPLAAQPLVSPRWNRLMALMNPPSSGTLFANDRIRWLRVMGRLELRLRFGKARESGPGGKRLAARLAPLAQVAVHFRPGVFVQQAPDEVDPLRR